MSLKALCGEASVDDHIRKVASTVYSVGILFHSVYDYVCGAIRQSKALRFLDQAVPHRIKRSIRMWIPEAGRL